MIGTKPATVFALIALTFPGAAWMHAEDRMRAGLWELTNTSDGKPVGGLRRTCFTLASRAPYFHNGSADSLDDVTEFYNKRFNIGFTPQEKRDLIAFLSAL
jgi:cytochrome c peroxidase